MTSDDMIFISNRERGIGPALAEVFLAATYAYCCQHIANNVQSRHGAKCWPLFWTYAQAKTKIEFDIALGAFRKESSCAAKYVAAIPHDS